MISGPAGKVKTSITRASDEKVKEFEKIPTSIIADCYARYPILDTGLKPVNPSCTNFAGSAVTVEDIEGGNFMSLFAIDAMKAGDVLVIDVKGITSRAGLGSINAEVVKRLGGKAIVVYGAVRDFHELSNIGIPIFCLGSSPAGPHKGVKGNVNTTIAIGSASISPGDIIIGDADGVVCVAKEDIEMVLEASYARLKEEESWMQIIEDGGSMLDVLNLRGKLAEFNVKEE